jgi:mono/diheme cytochrome c family protein
MKKNWLVSAFIVLILAASLAACSPEANKGAGDEAAEVARPSNAGGPGEAIKLQGDATKGAEVFQITCVPCHGDQGKGGVANPGSKDETVPPLNPIDSTMVSTDAKTFATNIDLFLEHGSTPENAVEGTKSALSMPGFGDQKLLQAQDIANVIAYVVSLNKK